MQIYNCAVIEHFMVCEEQIGEIRALFPVDFVCGEILVQRIIKYLMRFSMLISGFLWMDNRMGLGLCIHMRRAFEKAFARIFSKKSSEAA